MPLSPHRWKVVSPSRFPWEKEALEFIRERLGNYALHAWSNFEFIASSGAIYEVDLLVLTTAGLFLIEIKSWPGTLTGDSRTWTLAKPGGQAVTMDNPIFLANQKAKCLKGLLQQQKAIQTGKGVVLPYIEPLVFLSSPELHCRLNDDARHHVCLRDSDAQPGIIAALTPQKNLMAAPLMHHRVDARSETAVRKAMDELGIREKDTRLRIGDYLLDEIIFEGPGYQDRIGHHASLPEVTRRVRQYLATRAASNEERQMVARAARRDFQMVEAVSHPGILKALDLHDHEEGPAILFEYDPQAMRLDQYLDVHRERLDLWRRLQLLRQVADALRYAHGRKLIHRSLSPQSILVYQPASDTPSVKIMNWQTGLREDGTSGTVHVQELVESVSTAYIAPETLTTPKESGEYSDVFSLGAVGYHIITGSPPATSYNELHRILMEHSGLFLSTHMNGACRSLEELIRWSTHPDVEDRLTSVDEFLQQLDDVEEELTAPEEAEVTNPLEAAPRDRIAGGFTVLRRLGQGSVAVALLVERDGQELVLKVAQDPSDNDRLKGEAEILQKLKDPHIVDFIELLDVGGRTGLVMKRAGEKTLAQRLKEEGPLHLELLRRFGDDLLKVVTLLESKGIPHRDIKPGNIGVAEMGKDDVLHLVLFDFSLSRTPVDNIRAGTPHYLDPFLPSREPARWDLNAERYAAAVTLYEMATGVLPRWGDGRSDPALAKCELVIEAERFDASLRESLSEFFRKALHRNWQERYDNGEEMRSAWNDAFEEKRKAPASVSETQAAYRIHAIEECTATTPLAATKLSPGAQQALDRIGVLDVGRLLGIHENRIRYMRGVGSRTRKEILGYLSLLRAHLPIQEGAIPPPEEPAEAGEGGEQQEQEAPSIDTLARLVVGGKSGKVIAEERGAREIVLGMEPIDVAAGVRWPLQGEVGAHLRLSAEKVSDFFHALRREWRALSPLTQVRDDMHQILSSHGGVMSAEEMASSLLGARGSTSSDRQKRMRTAAGVVRAALEAEQEGRARFLLRRMDDRLFIALTPELAEYARRLGEVADRLAREDPLMTPARAVEALEEVSAPRGAPDMPSTRHLRLAVEASSHAALSSRQEIYPRGMEARRALILAHGALLGEARLKVEEIGRRVESRYPDAQALPGRPELDELLTSAGWDFFWSDEDRMYRRLSFESLTSSGAGRFHRFATTTGTRTPVSPQVAEARQFEERLVHAHRSGAFLVLMVQPQRMLAAERELLHRFALERLSLERLLLNGMKARAEQNDVRWDVVRSADASRGTVEWTRLLRLVKMALPAVEEGILDNEKNVLLVNPGLLARYDQMILLERLRDEAGRPGRPGVWVLVPCNEQHELPLLDGKAVPLLTPGQRARIPEEWLMNLHRGYDEQTAAALATVNGSGTRTGGGTK